MSITRRTIMKAAVLSGIPAGAVTAVTDDPLLDAVNAYRAGIKAFAALPAELLTKENEQQYAEATYDPAFRAITYGDLEARSIAGVREAIRLALEEDAIDDRLAEGALRSALAYLDGRMQP
jgi:hypothetical protein